MKTKVILVASQLLIAGSIFAGGSSSGTPPARTVEELLKVDSLLPGRDLRKGFFGKERIEQLLENLPSHDLIKAPEGRTLIPLTPENIRRLNVRTSTGIEALINTDSGESFRIKALDRKLIDALKAAEVIEKPSDAVNSNR